MCRPKEAGERIREKRVVLAATREDEMKMKKKNNKMESGLAIVVSTSGGEVMRYNNVRNRGTYINYQL